MCSGIAIMFARKGTVKLTFTVGICKGMLMLLKSDPSILKMLPWPFFVILSQSSVMHGKILSFN